MCQWICPSSMRTSAYADEIPKRKWHMRNVWRSRASNVGDVDDARDDGYSLKV